MKRMSFVLAVLFIAVMVFVSCAAPAPAPAPAPTPPTTDKDKVIEPAPFNRSNKPTFALQYFFKQNEKGRTYVIFI